MTLPMINLRKPQETNRLLALLGLVMIFPCLSTGWSGATINDSGAQTPVSDSSRLFGEDVVSLSAETAGLFSINNSNNYRYLPQLITVGWQLDQIGNEGWNRGNT